MGLVGARRFGWCCLSGPLRLRVRRLSISLRRSGLEVRVVALGVVTNAPEVSGWSKAGVLSILESETSLEELLVAIDQAERGVFTSSYSLASAFLAGASVPEVDRRRLHRLSARELEVLDLAGGGLTNKQIAVELQLGDCPTVCVTGVA